VVYVGDGQQSFDFLGFHCRRVASKKYRGKRCFQCWLSRRAMQRVRDRIKAITAPRHRLPERIGPIVAEENGTPSLMSGDWNRSMASGPQRLQLDASTAPDLAATAPALDSAPQTSRLAEDISLDIARLRVHNRACSPGGGGTQGGLCASEGNRCDA